jgi:methyl coenzyme M reductase beta subunit
MRNPKNSWNKNDTILYYNDLISYNTGQKLADDGRISVYIGPNDMKLAQSLI